MKCNVVSFSSAAASAGGAVTATITQVGHGLSKGDRLYIDASGDYQKADATDDEKVSPLYVSEVIDADTFDVAGGTNYRDDLSGLVPGEYYFISNTTPGALSINEPTNDGEVSAPVLYADSATSAWELPFRPAGIQRVGGIITDATVISNITDEANWDDATGNYTGSLLGLVVNDTYVDKTGSPWIRYFYDGSDLTRYVVNDIF